MHRNENTEGQVSRLIILSLLATIESKHFLFTCFFLAVSLSSNPNSILSFVLNKLSVRDIKHLEVVLTRTRGMGLGGTVIRPLATTTWLLKYQLTASYHACQPSLYPAPDLLALYYSIGYHCQSGYPRLWTCPPGMRSQSGSASTDISSGSSGAEWSVQATGSKCSENQSHLGIASKSST